MKEYQIRRPVDRPELYSVTARNVYKPSLVVSFVRNRNPNLEPIGIPRKKQKSRIDIRIKI